jgi:hypothetical protein
VRTPSGEATISAFGVDRRDNCGMKLQTHRCISSAFIVRLETDPRHLTTLVGNCKENAPHSDEF